MTAKAPKTNKSLKKFFHLVKGGQEMVDAMIASFVIAFMVAMWMKEPDVAIIKLILLGATVFSVVFVLIFFAGYSRYLSGNKFRYRKEVDSPKRSKSQEEMDYRIETMQDDNRWRESERADREREDGN
jgi:hypothetical protein